MTKHPIWDVDKLTLSKSKIVGSTIHLSSGHSVDGRKSCIYRAFYTSEEVVWDFFHQQDWIYTNHYSQKTITVSRDLFDFFGVLVVVNSKKWPPLRSTASMTHACPNAAQAAYWNDTHPQQASEHLWENDVTGAEGPLRDVFSQNTISIIYKSIYANMI